MDRQACLGGRGMMATACAADKGPLVLGNPYMYACSNAPAPCRASSRSRSGVKTQTGFSAPSRQNMALYYNTILLYPIFYLLKGDYRV